MLLQQELKSLQEKACLVVVNVKDTGKKAIRPLYRSHTHTDQHCFRRHLITAALLLVLLVLDLQSYM